MVDLLGFHRLFFLFRGARFFFRFALKFYSVEDASSLELVRLPSGIPDVVNSRLQKAA